MTNLGVAPLIAGGGRLQQYQHIRQASLESQRSSEDEYSICYTSSANTSLHQLQVPWFARPVPPPVSARRIQVEHDVHQHYKGKGQGVKDLDMYRPGLYTEDEVEMYPMIGCGAGGKETFSSSGFNKRSLGGINRTFGQTDLNSLPRDPRLWSRFVLVFFSIIKSKNKINTYI